MEFSSNPTQLQSSILKFSNFRHLAMTLSAGFKLAIIEAYYENGHSLIAVKHSLMSKSSQWGAVARNLSNQQILRVVKQLQTQHTLKNTSPRGRTKTVISDKNIERVKRKLELSPRRSTRSLARERHLSQSSVWRILREELKKYPYRIQLKEKQTTQNKKAIRRQ